MFDALIISASPVVWFISGIFSLYLALLTWQLLKMNLPRPLSLMFLAEGFFTLTWGVSLLQKDPGLILWLHKAGWLGLINCPVLWILFVIQQVDLKVRSSKPVKILLWLIPVITATLILLNGQNDPIGNDLQNNVILGPSLPGLAGRVDMVYSLALYAGSAVLLIRSIAVTPNRQRLFLSLCLLAQCLPWAFSVFNLLGWSSLSALAPIGLMVEVLLILSAILLETGLNKRSDGVLILNKSGIILEANFAATQFLSLPGGLLTGRSISEIIPEWDALINMDPQSHWSLTIKSPTRAMKLSLEVSPIPSSVEDGALLAMLVLISDKISPQKRDLAPGALQNTRAGLILNESFLIQSISKLIHESEANQRHQLDQAILTSQNQLRQIIDLVPHFIFAKDQDGHYLAGQQNPADFYETTVEALENQSRNKPAPSLKLPYGMKLKILTAGPN